MAFEALGASFIGRLGALATTGCAFEEAKERMHVVDGEVIEGIQLASPMPVNFIGEFLERLEIRNVDTLWEAPQRTVANHGF